MSKRKNLIVSAVFSFYLLGSVFQLLCGFVPVETGSTVDARMPFGWIYLRAKQYDENGNFLGCWGRGYDCMVIPIGQNAVTISTEGFGSQPAQMVNSK